MDLSIMLTRVQSLFLIKKIIYIFVLHQLFFFLYFYVQTYKYMRKKTFLKKLNIKKIAYANASKINKR